MKYYGTLDARGHVVSEPSAQDGPQERLRRLGPGALTVVELLALTASVTSDTARQLLDAGGGTLRALARRPAGMIGRGVAGVGERRAATVVAALELARRLATETDGPARCIRHPGDVHRWFGPALRDLPVEEFHLLTLDTQNNVTRNLLITRGIVNSALVHPREVFRAAIAEAAAGIVVLHNHPSGHPAPSADDRAVTRQLVETGRALDIPVYDHVIVAGDRYFSFAEAGLL